ncbi:MAG: hypothetical protein HY303_11030 [Candidatus Wallbacteria bacterium]|nr:hypothetical protein [Candidatus Wallbacteria bacterium]
MRSPHRQFRIALTGLFAALAFVLGRMPHPPGVECVTFAVFVAGYVGGAFVGGVSGAILAILQITFGGGANPLLATAQLIGFSTVGAAGHFVGRRRLLPGAMGLLGAALTAWYQLLVNLSLIPGSGLPAWEIFAAGAGFAVAHILCNAVVFEVGRFLLLTLERHPAFIAYRKSCMLPDGTDLKPV